MSETIRIGGLELVFHHSKDETEGSIDVMEMTVQPKANMPVPHYHESWDETVYGLDGVMTWHVNGEERDLHPGQTLFIKRGVVHGFRNTSDHPARCLCILSPGVLGPGYFREMADAIGAATPDRAKMKEIMLRHGLIPVV